MASFTLFDKPHFTGINAAENPEIPQKKQLAQPIAGVQWQVLTVGGLRMSCTSTGALSNLKHPPTQLAAVSHNGNAWRSYPGFMQQLDRGVRPEIAIEQTPLLDEDGNG